MIQIFRTGGTFEKKYNELSGKLEFERYWIKAMLDTGRCTAEYNIKRLMLIDSLEMTDQDRQLISDNCLQTTAKQILIIHGTDTMTDTAQWIQTQLKKSNITDKTIVLTGAMIPSSIKNSDAPFNLGFAVAAVQTLSPGVHIAMNGKFFQTGKTQKNKELGVFEALK